MSRPLIRLGALFCALLLVAAGRVAAADATQAAADPEGTWAGTLKLPAGELHAILHIRKSGDHFTATMDSPDQGAYGMPCDQVLFRNGKIQIVLLQLGGIYNGKLSSDGQGITGFWTQGEQVTPLDLSRISALLSPRMLTFAYWVPLILLSAFFLRLACGLCRADLPSWPRALISVLVVSFLAYLTFDFTAYLIMRSMQGVLVEVPPSYSYALWFREPILLKWIILSKAGPLRYLPIVFALCAAGVLQVIVLQADVTFRFGLLIVLLQWAATAVAGYILALLFGVAMSEAAKATQSTPVPYAPTEAASGPQKPGQPAGRWDQRKGKKPVVPPGGTTAPEATTAPATESTSLQVLQRKVEDATTTSRAYAENAWRNLKDYADPYLADLKQQLAPLTRHLPESVQRFLEEGGWWAVLAVLGLIALLWLRSLLRRLRSAAAPRRKKKKRRTKIAHVKLEEDLQEVGDAETEEGARRLTVRGVPARLRLVILSMASRDTGGLSEEMVDRILDWIKPGLSEVVAGDYPRVRLWPPLYSRRGFATALHANVPIPESKGQRSHWVVVAGQVTMGRATVNVGLGLYTDEPTTLRNLDVPGEQWLDVLGVKDSRRPVAAR